MIVAVIPAHNESEWIEKVVANLADQTCPPDRIIVMSDNSTDDTVGLARRAGAEVWESEGNTRKKAGALNQALDRILGELHDLDYVFIQDADTMPAPRWLEVAGEWAQEHPGAIISGRYASPPTGKSLLRIVQENEFARDGRAINRRGNKTRIVVGTSALLPVSTLRAIIRARLEGKLPGPRVGQVYSTASITEDYELTLALKTLGIETLSPAECDAVTDVMPTLPELWNQRIRWQRGAFTDLRTYGLTKVTRWYYAAQAMWGFGMLTVVLIVAQIALVVGLTGHFSPSPIWLGTLPLFVAHRIISVQRTGAKGMLVAATLIPETAYDFFRYGVYLTCAWRALVGKETRWLGAARRSTEASTVVKTTRSSPAGDCDRPAAGSSSRPASASCWGGLPSRPSGARPGLSSRSRT
ncbi:MAG TPA: glycosyltransferase family 2 protein [Trebonia sp.]|jgi:cellulose synthase/poly-beta-1,6-N-acetylglucosamine synthase-like glycosyltransferase|nr:glycosyltransferase family 2 protein [Trebonia sp.]